jgi:hypothetical protein
MSAGLWRCEATGGALRAAAAQPTLARAGGPRWSLRALRLLVGYAIETAPEAVSAIAAPDAPRGERCRLLFDAIALALVSAPMRCALDGLLAPLLAPEAERFAQRSLSELAALHGGSLCRRGALALIWWLGRHPSWAARRLEERVSLALELRLAREADRL